MKKILVPTLALTLIATGCSLTWLSTFENYLKIAGPILIQILDIVSLAKGTAPNPALVAKITADQTAVETLAQSVSTAASANLPTTCAAFNQAVSTFSNDLSTIEVLANTGPKVTGEVNAAIGIAQAAIAEVEVPIAACQAAPTTEAATAVLKSASFTVTSPSDVVKRFNAVVDAKHRVHLHNKAVRIATLGFAQ